MNVINFVFEKLIFNHLNSSNSRILLAGLEVFSLMILWFDLKKEKIEFKTLFYIGVSLSFCVLILAIFKTTQKVVLVPEKKDNAQIQLIINYEFANNIYKLTENIIERPLVLDLNIGKKVVEDAGLLFTQRDLVSITCSAPVSQCLKMIESEVPNIVNQVNNYQLGRAVASQ
jgi:hypothetical protein